MNQRDTPRAFSSFKMLSENQKLYIFDTTLRDGEQSPGVCLSVSDKVALAKSLCSLGVDVLEAGFPVASPGDFEAVQTIAREVGSYLPDPRTDFMTICALSRAVKNDIQRAFDAIKDAPKKRIHTFLATSDVHLKHKLKLTREECLKKACDAVCFAKSLVDDVEFSPEDAGRSERDFLCQVLSAVIEAGATVLNIPDTVGYNTPEEYGELICYLIKNTKGSDKVIWSTHCHNDLGLATANTLAGILNGARQVEVTVNGIGERAGNTSLEEVVMAIYTHPRKFPVYTDIQLNQIYRISREVSQKTGMIVQPNKAIVGENAFAHESGIHQDGFLKCQETYEIIHPSVVGVPQSTLVLGKHSGRNAFKSRMKELGYDIEDRLDELFKRFKLMADSKKNGSLTDADLIALVETEKAPAKELFKLKDLVIENSFDFETGESRCTATIEMHSIEGLLTHSATEKGPIEAIFESINKLCALKSHMLLDYEVKSVTEGEDSLGSVVVKLNKGKKVYIGRATHYNVLVASAMAYTRAANSALQ